MRYIPKVLNRLTKITKFLAIFASLSLWAQSTSIKTHGTPGSRVSDDRRMKEWLAKIPVSLQEINTHDSDVKITHIDIKWNQSKKLRTVAKLKRRSIKKSTYTCTLHLTIEYQDSANGEESPNLVATPAPFTVNSRCDTYLAKNNFDTSDDDTNS